ENWSSNSTSKDGSGDGEDQGGDDGPQDQRYGRTDDYAGQRRCMMDYRRPLAVRQGSVFHGVSPWREFGTLCLNIA
ncbi:hypothetical protein, partial [Clostridium perfringens]